jgi:hypothetical protein
MSKELAAEFAMKMVITDAIAKGKIKTEAQIQKYLRSNVFVKAASRYTDMFMKEFN